MKRNLIDELLDERARQDDQWGGPAHDDEHTTDDFFSFICRQVNKPGAPERERLLRIAALAVAAIESFDRKAEKP